MIKINNQTETKTKLKQKTNKSKHNNKAKLTEDPTLNLEIPSFYLDD